MPPIRSCRRVVLLATAFTFMTLLVTIFFVGRQNRSFIIEPTCGYWKGWNKIENLFTFGDSWTSTGFIPYGPQPNDSNVIGNPPYPGFTSTNGPIWFEHLINEYNDSSVKSYNLASGGAVVDAMLVKQFLQSGIRSLIEQIRVDWLGNYGRRARIHGQHADLWKPTNTLFAIWIGINDVTRTNDTGSIILPHIFNEYEMLLSEMYNGGARNFVLLDVPPMHRSPMGQTGPLSVLLLKSLVIQWNRRLQLLVRRFQKGHMDAMLTIYSTYELFEKIMDNPRAFAQTRDLAILTPEFCMKYAIGHGILETHSSIATAPCKGALNEYFWLNSVHPTLPIHQVTGEGLAKHLRSIAPSRQCMNPLEF